MTLLQNTKKKPTLSLECQEGRNTKKNHPYGNTRRNPCNSHTTVAMTMGFSSLITLIAYIVLLRWNPIEIETLSTAVFVCSY